MSVASPAVLHKSAVAIVLARESSGGLRVLVGRRQSRSRFLGGFYAFPGGVADREDGDLDREGEDACLRRAASRELEEETGVRVAPEAFLPAGRRVTPPFSPRRFDSLMYVAELAAPIPPGEDRTDELEDLGWEDPRELHRKWRALEIRVAPPLIPILEELAESGEGTAAEIAGRLRAVNALMEEDGPRIEFVPDVLMIPVPTPTLPPATTTNCYLIGSREFVILDPGCAEESELARLVRHVRRREAGGRRRARAVILSHHHVDHVGGATALAAELAVPVLAHPATLAAWGERAVRTEPLEEGAVLPLEGGERIWALHTPGHADGHLAFLEEAQGSLFAGDLVSGVSTILVGSGRGDLDRYLASLARVRDLGARTLFPAHGPPMIAPKKALARAIAHRHEREGQIVAALESGPRAIEEIVREAYADTPQAAHALAARQATVHLEHLAELGRVRRDAGRWELVG